VLKLLQLRRWAKAQAHFEDAAGGADGAEMLYQLAVQHGEAPGARVVQAIARRRNLPAALEGVAKRAIVDEQKRASSLMPMLASIGSAAPFVGLFGTVWGIMDAFMRIGREKSASLPVVAPAIGEALIATAIGLFAAIPAVVAYNAISKRVDDLLTAVEASSAGWVAVAMSDGTPVPLARRSERPPPLPGTNVPSFQTSPAQGAPQAPPYPSRPPPFPGQR
jgi:biopolymer transport protein TolQ